MVLTALALVLSIVGIAALPCWCYSARWGYAPSAVLGICLFFVAVLIVGGKVASSEALAARLTTPTRHEQPIIEAPMIERPAGEKAATQSAVTVAGPPIPLRRNVEIVQAAPR